MAISDRCPCGSSSRFLECCDPLIKGLSQAPTPEALMRSRYSAFVIKDSEYLLMSWRPSTRPAEIDLDSDPVEWIGLTIEDSCGGESDLQGEVTFRARFRHQGEVGELHEKSRFVREDGRWFYLDGEQLPSAKIEKAEKIGRNSPCPCGSGKKYKRCCGG